MRSLAPTVWPSSGVAWLDGSACSKSGHLSQPVVDGLGEMQWFLGSLDQLVGRNLEEVICRPRFSGNSVAEGHEHLAQKRRGHRHHRWLRWKLLGQDIGDGHRTHVGGPVGAVVMGEASRSPHRTVGRRYQVPLSVVTAMMPVAG